MIGRRSRIAKVLLAAGVPVIATAAIAALGPRPQSAAVQDQRPVTQLEDSVATAVREQSLKPGPVMCMHRSLDQSSVALPSFGSDCDVTIAARTAAFDIRLRTLNVDARGCWHIETAAASTGPTAAVAARLDRLRGCLAAGSSAAMAGMGH